MGIHVFLLVAAETRAKGVSCCSESCFVSVDTARAEVHV